MAKSYEDLVAEAQAVTEQVSVEEVREVVEVGGDVKVVDVREPDEWEEGHIPGATHIPRVLLELQSAMLLPDKDARIVVHCARGGRGALATKTLQEMGYGNVANMEGGLDAWRERGHETG